MNKGHQVDHQGLNEGIYMRISSGLEVKLPTGRRRRYQESIGYLEIRENVTRREGAGTTEENFPTFIAFLTSSADLSLHGKEITPTTTK